MNKQSRKGHTVDSMETPATKVTILPLPTAASALDELRAGSGGGRVDPGAAVLVAGADSAAVGELVSAFRVAGVAAAGWVGDPSDPAVAEMAAELFPGCEVVASA
jgi:hypothetical protein